MLLLNLESIIEAWAVQWLGHWPLVIGFGVRFPDRPARLEINFWAYTYTGWFTDIELVLDQTTWVNFLPMVLVSIV